MQFSAKQQEHNNNKANMMSHYGHSNLFGQQLQQTQNYHHQSYHQQQNDCYNQTDNNHNQNYLSLKTTSTSSNYENLVHKQSQSASRLRQLTEFALQQRQQAVANELAAKAAEAAAAAALARHQQELEAAGQYVQQHQHQHQEPFEQVAAGAGFEPQAEPTGTTMMLVDAPDYEQPAGPRHRVNSIGRLGQAPPTPPAPLAARSMSFSSGGGALRTGSGDHFRCEACAEASSGGQCRQWLSSSSGASCDGPRPTSATSAVSATSAAGSSADTCSSYLSSGPRSCVGASADSGPPSSGSMSANDALSLGINLEQYISKRNERERSRVRNVNDAFDNLKNSLPLDVDRLSKRMSKVEILRTAISYIRDLEVVLGTKQQQQENQYQLQQVDLVHLQSPFGSPRQLVAASCGSNVIANNENSTTTSAMTRRQQQQQQQLFEQPYNTGILMTNNSQQQYLNRRE